jgi:hypothetical protein
MEGLANIDLFKNQTNTKDDAMDKDEAKPEAKSQPKPESTSQAKLEAKSQPKKKHKSDDDIIATKSVKSKDNQLAGNPNVVWNKLNLGKSWDDKTGDLAFFILSPTEIVDYDTGVAD